MSLQNIHHPIVEHGLVAGGRVVGVQHNIAVSVVEDRGLWALHLGQRLLVGVLCVRAAPPHAPHAQRTRAVVRQLGLLVHYWFLSDCTRSRVIFECTYV